MSRGAARTMMARANRFGFPCAMVALLALLAGCATVGTTLPEASGLMGELLAVAVVEPAPLPAEPVEELWIPGPLKEQPREVEYLAPYASLEVMSGFWECRGRRRHAAYDLFGDGDNAGLGTPITSIGTARIVTIGTPTRDSRAFGRQLRSRGQTTRGGRRLPASDVIDGYGRVYFFTRSSGSWESGAIVVTELLDGPLVGYTVRYMHLGAVHPALSEGDLVKPGTELGLFGGTGVQRSSPHLHIDLADPEGNRVDIGPYLGIPVPPKSEIGLCGRRR